MSKITDSGIIKALTRKECLVKCFTPSAKNEAFHNIVAFGI